MFVSNRVRKIAKIVNEVKIEWKYCISEENIADPGSRGANLDKMEKAKWFDGPDWLLEESEWPDQPELKCTPKASEKEKPSREVVAYAGEEELDEWDYLLLRTPYWGTLRVTAWILRFVQNCQARKKKLERKKGPLCTEEILRARDCWVRRVQKNIPSALESPGWKLEMDKDPNILKCVGRIQGYRPTYLEDGTFVQKLIRHTHEQTRHMGVANTMAGIRDNWWIPHLRSLVKKQVHQCNICKVFSTNPYRNQATVPLPKFLTEVSRPFQHTGVDFVGPLIYRVNKKEVGKAYIIIFTCAVMRAVHLEVTKSQAADEFQMKLNAFITRRTRPECMISDNAQVFKSTANWIRNIRKSEKLQDVLAKQEITWMFNLAKSPWWGCMYERLIKDIKKTLYKTLGKTHLTFEQLEVVIMDIERHLNNRPLTYVESDGGDEKVLTPNIIMWGQDAHIVKDIEVEENQLTKLYRRLNTARQHASSRWQKEYVHSLLESHRINRDVSCLPKVREIVLIIGEEKNRGEWKKAKVLRLVKGKDNVVRGIILLHKGKQIERPVQSVCLLEVGNSCGVQPECIVRKQQESTREKRTAAVNADLKTRLRLCLEEEDD